MTRQQALNLLAFAVLNPPVEGRIAHLEGIPKEWHDGDLYKSAYLVLRPAVEGGASLIRVKRGAFYRDFPVMDLLAQIAKEVPIQAAKPKHTKVGLAATYLRSVGAVIDHFKGFLNIPFVGGSTGKGVLNGEQRSLL